MPLGSLEEASCFFLNIPWNLVVDKEPITGGSDCSSSVCLTAFIHGIIAGPTLYFIWYVPWRRALAALLNPISSLKAVIGLQSLVPPSNTVCWRCCLFCASSIVSISLGVVTSHHVCLGLGRTDLMWYLLLVLSSSTSTSTESDGRTLSVWWV